MTHPLNRPPQVLIIDHTSALGGAELSLEGLVTAMDVARYRHTVTLPHPGPLSERLVAKRIPVKHLPIESWRWWINQPKQIARFLLTFPLQVLSLLRWIGFLYRLRPDIVHFNINRLVEPVLAAWLLRIPSAMHFRDIPSRMEHRFVFGWDGFYGIMNLADYWIANSAATERDLHSHARRPIRNIPNGIDLDMFDQMAGQKEKVAYSPVGSFTVVMIALLVPWKDHPAYIQLAQRICSRRDDIVFLIAGSGDAKYTAELQQLANKLGVAQKVKFLGHVNNVPMLLSQVDLLVHTTDREPFGRVFIEAMAARRPAVAFNSGGAAEIIVDGETGILVPVGDLDAMATTVFRLLDDTELRKRMGDAGRRRVEEHYTIEKHCQAVASLYDELLVGKS